MIDIFKYYKVLLIKTSIDKPSCWSQEIAAIFNRNKGSKCIFGAKRIIKLQNSSFVVYKGSSLGNHEIDQEKPVSYCLEELIDSIGRRKFQEQFVFEVLFIST